jgi:hypothetical protein
MNAIARRNHLCGVVIMGMVGLTGCQNNATSTRSDGARSTEGMTDTDVSSASANGTGRSAEDKRVDVPAQGMHHSRGITDSEVAD